MVLVVDVLFFIFLYCGLTDDATPALSRNDTPYERPRSAA